MFDRLLLEFIGDLILFDEVFHSIIGHFLVDNVDDRIIEGETLRHLTIAQFTRYIDFDTSLNIHHKQFLS